MRLFVGFCLFFLGTLAQAELYKWIDDKGRTRYGEKPPAGVPAVKLGEELDPETVRRQAEMREALERKARAAQVREQQCEKLREELATTESTRLFRFDGGEKVYLSDAERRAHATKVRALIDEHCR
jgi:hypothetical protein